jgi:hypothetical protein
MFAPNGLFVEEGNACLLKKGMQANLVENVEAEPWWLPRTGKAGSAPRLLVHGSEDVQ